MSLPKVSGSASGMASRASGAEGLILSSGLSVGDVTDAAGVVSWSYSAGQVAQVTVPVVDLGRALSKRGLLREGVTLTADGDRFEVSAVSRDYRGADIWLEIEARDWLGRRLRRMTGPDTTKDVTPKRWIETRVARAGGVAVVQGGSPARTVHQGRGQSVLAVIEALASDTGVQWVSHGGRLFCGTGWWALNGGPGLPTWAVDVSGALPFSARALECAGFSSRSSLDSRDAAAEATLTVVADRGREVRPWHLVDVRGADSADEGAWLVRDVSFDEESPSVSVKLERPLKSSPKKGSGSDSGTGSPGSELDDLGPIAGSSYRDARRPSGWRGASVDAMVQRFRANPGGLGHTIYRGCLWYAQEVAGYSHYGDHPKDLIDNVLGARLVRSKTVVPGAVMLFTNASIGHAVAYIGGGRCIGTDMDSSGKFTPSKWAIGPVDAMERSFGVTFYGWYAPP